MFTIVFQILGWFVFAVAAYLVGVWLRRHPSRLAAEKTSRMLHFIFWFGLAFPGFIGLFYPGYSHYDEILGFPSLPFRQLSIFLGILILLAGAYLLFVSNLALRRLGQGANAFVLTRKLVVGDIYQRTRNPMSLGYYLVAVGLGLVVGSTVITLGALFGIIPAHLFSLKYFEELELELRLGSSYLEYKRKVPFLFPRWTRTSN